MIFNNNRTGALISACFFLIHQKKIIMSFVTVIMKIPVSFEDEYVVSQLPTVEIPVEIDLAGVGVGVETYFKQEESSFSGDSIEVTANGGKLSATDSKIKVSWRNGILLNGKDYTITRNPTGTPDTVDLVLTATTTDFIIEFYA